MKKGAAIIVALPADVELDQAVWDQLTEHGAFIFSVDSQGIHTGGFVIGPLPERNPLASLLNLHPVQMICLHVRKFQERAVAIAEKGILSVRVKNPPGGTSVLLTISEE